MNDQNQPCAYEQELLDQYARDAAAQVPPEPEPEPEPEPKVTKKAK